MTSPSLTHTDESYMRRCIELAQMGAGYVAPNPMVGAVLVYEGSIIGEGYHAHYGEAHAEVNCIHSVKEENKKLIPKSTLYVSLEPCAHFGKTPPCADLIIRHRIPRVVIGCRDPFEQVNGKGIEKLTAAGVDVVSNVLEKECRELNKRFFTFHILHRPYIILKWAQSSNHKIAGAAGSERLLISNGYSNRLVHRWRSEEAGILIGTNTALSDDPELTTRLWSGPSPVRLVVDMKLRLPANLKIFNKKAKTIIFNATKEEEGEWISYYRIKQDAPLVAQLAEALYRLKIQSVLVEGGARLLQSFIDEKIWDEARIITNTVLDKTGGLDAPGLPGTSIIQTLSFLNDKIDFIKAPTASVIHTNS